MGTAVTCVSPDVPAIAAQRTVVALRPPEMVMRLARIGSFHQTRLSFKRVLMRRLAHEGWRFSRTRFDVDARGEGVAVYRATGPLRSYSLVCFAHDLPAEKRTDRVIAEEWDAAFALFNGDPSDADITRLHANVPLQEAGRVTEREIVLARANKSVRLFDQVATSLAAGHQPPAEPLAEVGYLMRTTAVYGSGKFGLAVREALSDRPELSGPFQAEMLAVFLIRAFTFDLVDHAARVLAPATAVPLAPVLRRSLGVGNATGLGMAPFLVNHPALIDRWISARETALARVRGLPAGDTWAKLPVLVKRARNLAEGWRTTDLVQQGRIAGLAADLDQLASKIGAGPDGGRPFDALYLWAEENLRLEAQEMLVSLLIEPHGDIVDDLAERMSIDEDTEFTIDGAMTLAKLKALVERHYPFARDPGIMREQARARFWYVSEEKLEPRLGERYDEPGSEREQPLGIAQEINALHNALPDCDANETVAEFVLENPDHRYAVRRVQIAAHHPYGEIQDNLLSAEMRPIDLLRCKLACFGATKFDPKSDRWVRITLFQNAPLPEDIGHCDPDDWALPPLDGAAA